MVRAETVIMIFKSHSGWILTAILVAALVVRLAAGVWWQQRLPVGQKFAFGDSEGYWELARKIARGQPYEYGPDNLKIFRAPGISGLALIAKHFSAVFGNVGRDRRGYHRKAPS